jgi:hypothetical protein
MQSTSTSEALDTESGVGTSEDGGSTLVGMASKTRSKGSVSGRGLTALHVCMMEKNEPCHLVVSTEEEKKAPFRVSTSSTDLCIWCG